jgi:tetratricopeptide (TPR) repeat protein
MSELRVHLSRLRKNLNILREREARYGGNAPIELHNQIADHLTAIALTEQTIRGEFTVIEWREKLKPLLVSLNVFGEFFGPKVPLQRPPRTDYFTGRKAELAQLLKALQPGQVVTLCGPAGIGKTALAAEVVWILAPNDDPPDAFPDGICWYTFYEQQPYATLALEEIARAFGEDPRQGTPETAAKRALGGRWALLILDGAENADNLQAVLEVRSGCGVLVTSSQHKDAAVEWQDIGVLPLGEAVTLLQAWGGTRAADELVARQICELVGRLPLAIRLVGRYLKQQAVEAVDYLEWLQKSPLAALNQGQRRLESVPYVLERSLAKVSETAQQALAVVGRLAMTSFDREVIAATLDIPIVKAGWLLGELVNHGLLLRPDQRYDVSHALIHTFARQRGYVPQNAILQMAAHYVDFVQEQENLGLEGYIRLDTERAHLMAVLSECVKQEGIFWYSVRALSLTMNNYLEMQGHATERVIAMAAGLEAARRLDLPGDEETFLIKLGLAYRDLGQVDRAIEYYKQVLTPNRGIVDQQVKATALGNLGVAYYDLGQLEQAIVYHEDALILDREIGDRQGEGKDLGNLGAAYLGLGQMDKVIEFTEQALAIAREIRDRRSEGISLGNLGAAYYGLGQMEQAIEFTEQALTIACEIGDRHSEGRHLNNLGNAYCSMGHVERGQQYLNQSLVIFEEIKIRFPNVDPVPGWLDELYPGGWRW